MAARNMNLISGTLPMNGLDTILQSLNDARGNSHVRITGTTSDEMRVSSRSGRLARWVGKLQSSANREATRRFIDCLNDRYGTDLTGRLVSASGLDRSLQSGRPLRVRLVREVATLAMEMRIALKNPDAGVVRLRPIPPPPHAPELVREVRKSVDRGYANQFVLKGDPRCEHPMPDTAFLGVVKTYNEVLEDLHNRFPQLRDIRPPNLSQNSLDGSHPDSAGKYDVSTSTLEFSQISASDWSNDSALERSRSGISPQADGFKGVLMHELGHHLSSPECSDQRMWLLRLAVMLTENGFISDPSKIDTASVFSPTFAMHVGKQARTMGAGTYAGTDAGEFAAEVLAWRMAPGYGESHAVPRMPRYLEAWVHDSFPFTRDGHIPDSCVEFDPATIKEPAIVDGTLVWRDRGPAPALPPRPRTAPEHSARSR